MKLIMKLCGATDQIKVAKIQEKVLSKSFNSPYLKKAVYRAFQIKSPCSKKAVFQVVANTPIKANYHFDI